MRALALAFMEGAPGGAQAACFQNAVSVQVTDRNATTVAGIVAGAAGTLLVSAVEKANTSEREQYAAALMAKLPSDRLSVCLADVRLVAVKVDLDGAATRLTHQYEIAGQTVTFGEVIKASMFPSRPRQVIVMRNNKYVDLTAPMPTQEEAEARFTASYLRALDRIAVRLAKKHPI